MLLYDRLPTSFPLAALSFSVCSRMFALVTLRYNESTSRPMKTRTFESERKNRSCSMLSRRICSPLARWPDNAALNLLGNNGRRFKNNGLEQGVQCFVRRGDHLMKYQKYAIIQPIIIIIIFFYKNRFRMLAA